MRLESLDDAGSRRPAVPPAGGGARRALLLTAKVVVSVGLLAAVVAASDLAALATLLARLQPAYALAAVLLLMGIAVVSGLRWWVVGRLIGAPLPLASCVPLMFIGSFFTQVLPTSVGGDAVRILLGAQRGLSYGKAFNGVMLERASGLLALVLMVAGGVLWLGARIEPAALRYLLLAALPGLLVVLAALCCLDCLPLPAPLARVARHFLSLAGDARRVLLAPGESTLLLLLSAAAQLFSVAAVLALARGLGLPLAGADALALVPAIILITFFPLSFAGWGVREGASVVMLGFAGIGADEAIAVSVTFGLAVLVAGLPGMAFWLAAGRRRPEERR